MKSIEILKISDLDWTVGVSFIPFDKLFDLDSGKEVGM